MLSTDTIQALVDMCDDVTPWDFAQIHLEHTPPRTCAACNQPTEVLCTTGIRWVCLDCAHTLTLATEQRQAVPA